MFVGLSRNLFGTAMGLIALAALLLAPGFAFALDCDVPEGPPGTITLPPDGCGYLSPDDVHMILDDLPPGTTIEIGVEHKRFFCGEGAQGTPAPCSVAIPAGQCEAPGGSLGGTVDCFFSEAELTMNGTGALAGFSRTITIPVTSEVHAGPRTPGDPVQGFDTEMVQLDGQIFGDPDFAMIQISAGSDLGLPSPGHTTLTDQGATFQVDSFFDISYRIDFQGAPGGQLDGLSGTTVGTITMGVGDQPISTPALSQPSALLLSAVVMGASIIVLRRFRVTA